jgi:hypothetical protein
VLTDQVLIVLLRDGAWSRITQADDSQNLVVIGGQLASQEFTRSLPQQLCSGSPSAAGESVQCGTQACGQVDLGSTQFFHAISKGALYIT